MVSAQPSPAPVPAAAVNTPWWEILGALGPLAVLGAAILTFVIGWKTLDQRRRADAAALEQRREADRRSEWWARAQWAIDASLSEDPHRQETGLGVLNLLAQSDLAGEEEAAIISIASDEPLTTLMDAAAILGENDDIDVTPVKEADNEQGHTAEPRS
ncbi:hypothetical protein [Arthrobacter sp. YD2]|uniref:hypothetical protein n=1 Tax=Arthrobacter sp. YD2 TaxID=3058046 RepID=UPI0025B614BC|nr:hypothetical protein [Arthrobacter sp. YD2]MDN3904635.1 hypothetical protein [Arthrobacter sp. YD2]